MPLVADPRTGRAKEQLIRRHTASKAWFDLGRYARVVLAAQDSCRFVLGFYSLWIFHEVVEVWPA
jgi:hypothetical protein